MTRPWQDTSPEWLAAQYANAEPHAARIRLHQVCSQDSRGWYPLLFDQLRQRTPPRAFVFELGCGNGALWKENLHRIPPGWQLHLTDIYPDMLETARRGLKALPHIIYDTINGNDPFPLASETYDGVIANHMLYHLSSVPNTLREIHRILKKRGSLIATTTGPNHMATLFEYMQQFEPRFPERKITPRTFDTVNGASQLRKVFPLVERMDCLDTLVIREEHIPLAIDYVYSWHDARNVLPEKRRPELHRFFQTLIHEKGALHIEKEQAIFIATK